MLRRTRQGAVDVLHPTAPLDGAIRKTFDEAADECLNGGPGQIVVDLRDVSLISSTGLELLVELQEQCLRHGGALKVAAANVLCRDILDVTGVSNQLELFDDVAAAAGSFAQ